MKHLLTLLLCLAMSYCLAQNNWKPGFIVAAGDTTYGFVDERDSKSLSLECHFRTSAAADKKAYGPAELEAFGFTAGRLYVSRTPDEFQQPVFLEFLLKGRISLYHLMDDASRYFAEKEDRLYELKNSIQEIKQTGHSDLLRERMEYIGTLGYLLANSGVEHQVSQTKLQANSLVDLVYNYHMNVCPEEECIIYTRQKKPLRLELGIHGGYHINSFRMACSGMHSDRRTGNFVGLRMELHNGFDFLEKLSMMLDLNFYKFSDYHLTSYLPLTSPMDVNINTLSLNAPILITWNFRLGGSIRPYAGAGMVNMLILSQNRDFIVEPFYTNFGKTIPTYHYGVIGRTGTKIKTGNSTLVYLEASIHQTKNPRPALMWFVSNVFSINAGVCF